MDDGVIEEEGTPDEVFNHTKSERTKAFIGKIESRWMKLSLHWKNWKNGFWKEYHENGGVFSEGAYENNYKNGKWKYYYQNSKIKAEGNFQDDKKIGDWKYYYETGSVQEITNYEKSGTGLVERVMLYYPNGNLLGTQSHNNKIVSYLEYFDESGKKILENGTGKLIQYGDNGKKSYEAYYINSIRDGKATWYHSNGQIDQEGIYKYDPESKDSDKSLRWEIISSYDRNGKPREKGTLKEGNGTWISYNEDGSKSITTYKNGKKID